MKPMVEPLSADSAAGRQILLVAGWAQTEALVAPLKTILDELGHVTVMLLDRDEECLQQRFLQWLEKAQGQSPLVLGWSLGGLLSIDWLSRNNFQPDYLILLGCNPCFVQQDGWPGVAPEIFVAFQQQLTQPGKLIQRFTALQLMGSETSRSRIRELQKWAETAADWGDAVLAESLAWLAARDVRSKLSELPVSVLHLLGQEDRLVPAVELSEQLHKLAPAHNVEVIEGLAHIPESEEQIHALRQNIECWLQEAA